MTDGLVLVFQAVANDILEDPLELLAVHGNKGLIQRRLEGYVQPLFTERTGLLTDIVLYIGADVDPFPVEGDLPQVELGKEEQCPDQAGHVMRRIDDHIQVMGFFFRRVGNAVADAAGIAFDFRQRRRQIVGDAGQELFAVLIVLIPRIPGRPQLEAHLFESLASIADFIMR